MFCPNCGNKVQSSDNYCPVCGKNLKNVKIQIIEDEKSNTISQETLTFKPLKNISDIDSTDELKDIIKAVDEKISKNISEYQKKNSLPKDSEGPLKDSSNEVEDLSQSNDIKFKQENLDSFDSKSKSLEELEAPIVEEIDFAKATKKDSIKTSFFEKITDFINEDDDEFSIFSSLNNSTDADPMDSNKENLDLTQPEPKNFEDTMDVPPIIISENANYDKSSNKSYDYKSFTDLVNAELAKTKDNEILTKKVESSEEPTEKKNTPKKIFSNLKNKISDLNSVHKDSVNEETVHSSFDSDKTIKSSNSAFEKKIDTQPDLVKEAEKNVAEIKPKIKLDLDKKEELSSDNSSTNNKNNYKEKKKLQFNSSKNEKTNIKNIDQKSSRFKFDASLKDKSKNSLNISEFSNKLKATKAITYLNSMHEKVKNLPIKILLIFSIILSILPVAISMVKWHKFSIAIILLILVKIVIKLIQFYIPLNVAVEKAWIDSSVEEVKHFAVINYFLSEIIMLILFIFSPWYGLFYFNPLSSLTAFPIATIILVLFATSLSLSQFHDRLNQTNKVDFIGWYMILFIIFEFIGKLIFMFTNILI